MGVAVQVAEGPTVGGGWRLETRTIVMDLEIVLTLSCPCRLDWCELWAPQQEVPAAMRDWGAPELGPKKAGEVALPSPCTVLWWPSQQAETGIARTAGLSPARNGHPVPVADWSSPAASVRNLQCRHEGPGTTHWAVTARLENLHRQTQPPCFVVCCVFKLHQYHSHNWVWRPHTVLMSWELDFCFH